MKLKPVTYKTVDVMREGIEGSFYEQELRKNNPRNL